MCLNLSGLLLCLPPFPATTGSGLMDFDYVFIHIVPFFPLNLGLLLGFGASIFIWHHITVLLYSKCL
ncbi:hypothetical protein ES319_A04G039500v1 [Gossypium barbadense]|uniref:Uncharacterized protein n=3 Tax=Gossypium TaxID=3633 RepID=A0A5J5W447_GOSBA|nr:hypothetical protein ES319_A04G039500v1 [Gossypium barbadense]TYH21465.1 hypothetical protein ES288_A04G046700v1 [Gossypium darwinii]TYI32291.1 hypothetical protein ES332_A04G049400v1 [Gossypium tomentosum]